jgi:methionyl-tRNA synthetase
LTKEVTSMTTTYLTVAIPYVNASPHLGYAYELVEADIYARACRAAGNRVRFLGGTDDFSLKNVLAAEAARQSTEEFVKANSARFEELAGPLELSFDDFIKTSSDRRHAPAVERLWRACLKNGDLYKRSYEGDYCVGCEQFYARSELIDGRCPDHGTVVERVAEENWFFRLSAYQDHVERLISSRSLLVSPEPFREEVLAFVRRGLDDISVSRSATRARGWGIPVPDDPTQVIYVWFDALANYISALGFGDLESQEYREWWLESEERIHVIGKGILRFHAVYWPAFLAAAGEPAPTRIQVHPYLTVDGVKLSKSSGVAVDPTEIVADYGADALRWWFARDVGLSADADFTADRLAARANEDLANGLGNLVNRIVTLVHRFRSGVVPNSPAGSTAALPSLEEEVASAIAAFDYRAATRRICEAVGALNRDLEETKPWVLAKESGELAGETVDRHLFRYVASVREISHAVAPFVPSLSERFRDQLGNSSQLPSPVPAFPRIEGRRAAVRSDEPRSSRR